MSQKKMTLKEIRKKKGYSQVEVADRVGISFMTYNRIENDIERRKSVKTETIKGIADMLGIKMEDIL